MILEVVLPSLLSCHNTSLISLCIADAGSADLASLQQRLNEALPGRVTWVHHEGPFSRSVLLNKAVDAAPDGLLFISDADIALPADLVQRVNRNTDVSRVWFPVCRALLNAEGSSSEWYEEGMGLLACTKDQFIKAGRHNETFTSWGGEDQDLFLRFWKAGFFCLRTHEEDLIHHWHPSQPGAGKQW